MEQHTFSVHSLCKELLPSIQSTIVVISQKTHLKCQKKIIVGKRPIANFPLLVTKAKGRAVTV